MASEDTQFKKGWKGGPGRPKGAVSGRALSLQTLDKMLSKAGNQEKLDESLQEKFDKDPAEFLTKYIYPLAPKNIEIDASFTGTVTTENTLKDTIDKMSPEQRKALFEMFDSNNAKE